MAVARAMLLLFFSLLVTSLIPSVAATQLSNAVHSAAAADYTPSQLSLAEGAVPLTLLSDASARCLDGSPYGYYYIPGTGDNATKWSINIQGGGWCYNETLCLARAGTDLGSSSLWPKYDGVSPVFPGWNSVFMRYCDGASFTGYREEPWPVPGTNQTIYIRGARNLAATLDALIKDHSFGDLTELILTGGSAGGLSTILHADYVSSRVPNATKFRARPNCGFFLDHLQLEGPFNYPNEMKYVYTMSNSSHTLNDDCLETYYSEPWKCIMAPHAAPFVKAPLFFDNSRTDHWQLAEILFEACEQHQPYVPPYKPSTCSAAEVAATKAYGPSFLDQLEPTKSIAKNGGFIVACIIHGVPGSITIGNTTSDDAFARWYIDPTDNPWTVESCPGGQFAGPCNPSKLCAPFP